MLQNVKLLYGRKLTASDGDVGHVKDFYFDDIIWTVRYVVVETAWLGGRQVLLPPHAFSTPKSGRSDAGANFLQVNLSRRQIERSPPVDSHRPVSRQYEKEYYRYHGWPAYWQASAMTGGAGISTVVPVSLQEERQAAGDHRRDDVHLLSMKALNGTTVHAIDGEIGSVDSFMVDGKNWAIPEIVVETGHWYAGKTVILPTDKIARLSQAEPGIFLDLSLESVKQPKRNGIAHPERSVAERTYTPVRNASISSTNPA